VLLQVPPDRDGLLAEADAAQLVRRELSGKVDERQRIAPGGLQDRELGCGVDTRRQRPAQQRHAGLGVQPAQLQHRDATKSVHDTGLIARCEDQRGRHDREATRHERQHVLALRVQVVRVVDGAHQCGVGRRGRQHV
jgi:hypothetical protein